MSITTTLAENQTRVLLVSIVPPRNDCGVRVLMHRHLVERKPFELHVATSADFSTGVPGHSPINLPYLTSRLRKTRFGPRLTPWFADYENLVWALKVPSALDKAIMDFRPDVILTLAETNLCHMAAKAAKKHRLPLVGWFQDWFPIMKGHFGHAWTQGLLSRRYQALYRECDLALCISDGMKDVLGAHPNSHVIYPIAGQHKMPETVFPPKNGKFRLVYVGAAENFYGRMLCSLIAELEPLQNIEIVVVGPNADWPKDILKRAKAKGICLGFKPPEEAAAVLAGADALLVVMSFETEYRRFMETSFTTKFVDYTAFGKPIILWGPEYCAPARLVRRNGGAWVVDKPEPGEVVNACFKIATDPKTREGLVDEAKKLHGGLFSQERLQKIFVSEIKNLVS
jgi:glycosyltransferase involved in cell wall biosynthesis